MSSQTGRIDGSDRQLPESADNYNKHYASNRVSTYRGSMGMADGPLLGQRELAKALTNESS